MSIFLILKFFWHFVKKTLQLKSRMELNGNYCERRDPSVFFLYSINDIVSAWHILDAQSIFAERMNV